MDRTIGTHAPRDEAGAAAPGSTMPPMTAPRAFGNHRNDKLEFAAGRLQRDPRVAERIVVSNAGRQVRSRSGSGLFKGRGRARSMQMRHHS